MDKNASNTKKSKGYAAGKNGEPQTRSPAASSAAHENFHDSGYMDDDEQPAGAGHRVDFVLFEDDPPFIDEDDYSMIACHGSTYNGTNSERSARTQQYPSYNYDQQPSVAAAHPQGGSPQPPPDRSPLFTGFEAPAGSSMISEWVSTPHRHEVIAYCYEQPPYPADRQQAPVAPRSPAHR